MIKSLHNALSELELEYHELGEIINETIILTAKSLDAEGISEVIRINELAATFNLITKWNGHSIEIKK
ncbi:MAG: hypothetical protein WBF77_08120 [Sulfurimonadaceae bacterium]